MNQSLIQRYQVGGDIYQRLAQQFGTPGADAIAAAAATGDETAVNDALVQVKYGNPLDTSTADIFTNQMLTDPLAAPLEGVNTAIGNSVLTFLKNPWVLFAVCAGLFFFFGGGELIRGWFKRRS